MNIEADKGRYKNLATRQGESVQRTAPETGAAELTMTKQGYRFRTSTCFVLRKSLIVTSNAENICIRSCALKIISENIVRGAHCHGAVMINDDG